VLVPQIEPRACQVNATLTEQDRRTLGMIPKGRRAETLARSFEAFLQYAILRDPHVLRAPALPSISVHCFVMYKAGPIQGHGAV
jgi:hypothetical protein